MSLDRHLGQKSQYPKTYDPAQLVAIPRSAGRDRIGISGALPFKGADFWNLYELSWLDSMGKPKVATGELRVPASSPNLVESKSLKLYLNSLNNTRFDRAESVEATVRKDLSKILGVEPLLIIQSLEDSQMRGIHDASGLCLDDLEFRAEPDEILPEGKISPDCLANGKDSREVEETLYTHLLKSHCPVTDQPDWATLSVHYVGPSIDHESLLRYVISFRNHNEFHEQCVERIFVDLKTRLKPNKLSVLARYTRRGGIDINPFRSDFESLEVNERLWRQ